MREVCRDHRRVLIGRRGRLSARQHVDAGLVPAVGKAYLQPAGQHPLLQIAPAGAGGADPDQIDRAVADVVIAVAAEILGRKFPVARDQPFLHPGQHLAAALAAVPAVEREIEVRAEISEIVEERRRRRIPIRPHRPLVGAELRDLDKAPARLVEGFVVGLAEKRHADQMPVGAIAPAVIGAGEDRGVALVIAAHLHAAMAARIEEGVDLPAPVAAEDHQLLAHPRHEEITGVGDLAFMPDEQPGARKDPLQFLRVDRLVDENLAADRPGGQIDEAGAIP